MTDIPHNRLTHDAAERDAVAAVVASGYWAQGPQVAALEDQLAKAAGRSSAVATGSGLGALRLALIAAGVGPGDEVIVPAYGCVALANAVLACGAAPVIADVRAGDWNLDPASVSACMSAQTRAVIAVHTFGTPAPVAALRHDGVTVIEDCAHGLLVGGMGALGDMAITSFYATKLVGAGMGGAVLAGAGEAARIQALRDYEDQPADGLRLNDKMTDMAGALARCQLQRLPAMIERRAALARRYLEAFAPLAQRGVLALPEMLGERVWYRFAVESLAMDAVDAVERLRALGIGADLPVFDWRARDAAACPVADRAYRRLVSLPLYPMLTDAEQDRVITTMLKVFQAA